MARINNKWQEWVIWELLNNANLQAAYLIIKYFVTLLNTRENTKLIKRIDNERKKGLNS